MRPPMRVRILPQARQHAQHAQESVYVPNYSYAQACQTWIHAQMNRRLLVLLGQYQSKSCACSSLQSSPSMQLQRNESAYNSEAATPPCGKVTVPRWRSVHHFKLFGILLCDHCHTSEKYEERSGKKAHV